MSLQYNAATIRYMAAVHICVSAHGAGLINMFLLKLFHALYAVVDFQITSTVYALGKTEFHLTQTGLFAMLWAVLVTSIAAVLLLFWLLNRGSAAKVSSLFYLVPPIAVLETYVLFGEKINALGFIGIAMTTLGVALVLQN